MSVQLPYASAPKRIAAFAWDYLLIAIYMGSLAAITLVSFRIIGKSPGAAHNQPWLSDLLAFVTLVFPVFLYFALSEASSRGATWGKRRMELRVVSATGDRLPISRSLLRSGLKFLPWQIAHTSMFHIPGWPAAVEAIPTAAIAGLALAWLLAGLYVLGLVISPEHRTVYDGLAGSQVVYAERS